MKFQRNLQTGQVVVTLYFERKPDELALDPRAEEVIRKAVCQTLSYEGVSFSIEVSVTFCTGAYIRSLNAAYRGKDAETDVLSFPLFDTDEEDPIAGEVVPLGDIVINVDRAAEQGAALGHSALREMAFLAIHSTLHLLGYDHERSAEEEEEMCRRQREIIHQMEETETFI